MSSFGRSVGSLLTLAVTGCIAADAPRTATLERDSAGVTIVENDASRRPAACAVSPEPSLTIGTASGAAEEELYRVFGAVRLSNGNVALVNQGSQELRIYDPQGRFVAAGGRAGQGPGEFSDAFYLWVLPGDTLYVGDYRPWQFHVFSPRGEWVRTVRPEPVYGNPPGVLAVLDDGRAVLANRDGLFGEGRQFAERQLTVVVHAADGAIADTIGTFGNGRWGRLDDDPMSLTMYPLFESFAHITAAGSRIVAGHGAEPELRVLDAAAEGWPVERIIRWTTVDRTPTSKHVEAERERLLARYPNVDAEMRKRLVEPLISEARPVADRFPSFTSVQIGRDGRVWVREFTPPGSDESRRWLAFDSDGRLHCDARMPDVDQVLELGADYMLALDRDEDGVERVVMYGLAPPTGGGRESQPR